MLFRSNSGGMPVWLGQRAGVYACPGYNRVRGQFKKNAVREFCGSYGYNEDGARYGIPWDGDISLGLVDSIVSSNGVREGAVSVPSDMIALADSPLLAGFYWPSTPTTPQGEPDLSLLWGFRFPSTYTEIMYGLPANDPAVQAMSERHDARWNVGFCDGHAENLRGKQLFDLANPNVARRWNKDHQTHNQRWVPIPPP